MYYEIVLVGVLVSLLFTELTGFSPAGLIVPGYIALNLQTPRRVIYTLAVALMAWGLGKLLGKVMILLSFAINLVIVRSGVLAYDPGMIGVLVPGIVAQEMEKQGIVKSLLSLAVVTGILALIMMGFGMQVFPV